MGQEYGFSISKPVSIWNKPLKTDFKEFFKSLGKVAIDGAVGKWDDAMKDAIEAVSTLGFEKDCGQIAWALIYRSITQAIYELVEENEDLFTRRPKNIDSFCEELNLALEDSELIIDKDFFEHPKEVAIVTALMIPFSEWLKGFGLTEAQAEAISTRLPSYLVFALNDQWRSKPSEYACLQEMLDTPFTKASQREHEWLCYRAWLQKQINEKMFFEAFSLQQVYVPLRAYYEVKANNNSDIDLKRRSNEEAKVQRIIIDINQELEEWLDNADPRDAIRVICGGPGCGKSSFAKIFAANIADKGNIPVLFVPLHHLEIMDDLVDAVGKFIKYDQFLTSNPLDPENGEPRLLAIFDGLDELAMQGKVAAEIAQEFVREVQRKVERYNMHHLRLQVLITGRDLVVQSASTELRKPKQILHILSYYLSENERKNYIDDHKLVEQDQRSLWWTYFGKASGLGFTNIPEELSQKKLVEITTQPLLNYLIALSYTRKRIDFSKDSNLNLVYEDLLKSVYERGWADHPHPAVRGTTEEQFIRILEEMAVATWHGDGRTTTVKEIERHCENSGLKNLLESFQEGAAKGVTRLLTAFYFRKCGNQPAGDPTFEFTHKSFGEYLTARRIVRQIRLIHKYLKDRETDPDFGWDEREALKHWAELCGPTAMDGYLFSFVSDEIALQRVVYVQEWQQDFIKLINHLLRYGMPIERLNPRPNYLEESRLARKSEEALLAVLSICANLTETVSKIDWPSETSAGVWMSKLQGQRLGSENVLALSCLNYLDLSECVLHNKDLHNANLNKSYLINTRLVWAHLVWANFGKANLAGAYLRRANLEGANLEGANLERVNLERANLERANLRGANLEGANLEGANLEGANLEGANLERANLRGADLEGANLEGVNLEGANLEGAILKKATLTGTILENVNSQKTKRKNKAG